MMSAESECTVRDCVCYWHSFASPRTPRVAPGRDYLCIPAGADHGTPTWSLLVGLMEGAVLRLERLRVTRSGRILGRSDDELEFFHDMDMPTERRGFSAAASAALAPDGRSLCVLRHAYEQKPQAMRLTLLPETADPDEWELPLPEIQGSTSPCMPISAADHVWAVSATVEHGVKFSVVMRRLVVVPGHDGGWQQVGEAFTSPHVRDDDEFPVWGRRFLQGYAVLPGAALILVSFKQAGVFLTFAPDSGDWTLVPTDATRPPRDYVPILGRGVYVEQDGAVYMLRHNTIYAYKLTFCQDDDQGRQQLGRLDPPITIDTICPFNSSNGYGFLTRLQDRLMCSVWISLAARQPCRCDNLHAIVTTFHLRDPAQGGGIQVLHSSFRQVDMWPNPPDQEFCFLLEYEDEDSTEYEEEQEDSYLRDDEPSKMLDCCRSMMEDHPATRLCFHCGGEGHVARDCSVSVSPQEHSLTNHPSGPSPTLPVYPASRRHQIGFPSHVVPVKPAAATINKDLFIICQAGSQSFIYKTGVMDTGFRLEGENDGEPHQPCFVANNDDDDDWHFFYSDSKIHAVSCKRDSIREFSLNKDRTMIDRLVPWPTADPFVMVIRVGRETIALTETLQVFHQTRFSYDGSTTWSRYEADASHVLCRRVMISGYVVLDDHSFIVWDAVTWSCLLFDLGAKKWRVVMPWAAFAEDLPRTSPTNCNLNGRCVFVDGFIYTCGDGELAAYQLLHIDHSVYLSEPIFLPFSWQEQYCVGEDMCLDYAGKDLDSGAILFYVVQGRGYYPPEHDVNITIVQVKTKRTSSNKREPVGVNPVDRVTRSIRHKETLDTRCCFAVSSL